MNTLFHAFTPGFDFWHAFAPISILLTAAFAWILPRRSDRHLKFAKSTAIAKAVAAIVCTAAMIYMVPAQSFAGLLQFFSNGLGTYENVIYAILAAGIVCAGIIITYFCAIYFIPRACYQHKINLLQNSLKPRSH